MRIQVFYGKQVGGGFDIMKTPEKTYTLILVPNT